MTAGAARRSRLFWVSALLGWAVMAWGLRGALQHAVDTRPPQLLRFILGGLLLHDAAVVPLALASAWVVARAVRGPGRGPVQAALVVSGCLALFAYPLVRGYGRALRNPTSLPHDYGRNLLLVLAAVWAVTAIGLVVARLRRSRASS